MSPEALYTGWKTHTQSAKCLLFPVCTSLGVCLCLPACVCVCVHVTDRVEELALQRLVGADFLEAPATGHVGPLAQPAAGGVQQDPVKTLRGKRRPWNAARLAYLNGGSLIKAKSVRA